MASRIGQARRRWAVACTIVVLGLGVAAKTVAFDDPDGFRGVPWGASEEELRAKLGGVSADGRWRGVSSCFGVPADQRWLGDRLCSGAFLLGDVKVDATYKFRGGRFAGVLLTFESGHYERIARIFVDRYGPPTGTEERPYRTQGGAQSTNQILEWKGALVLINVQRHGDRITRGLAGLWTQEERAESGRLYRDQGKGAAKDL
jgi:hypothetical protein